MIKNLIVIVFLFITIPATAQTDSSNAQKPPVSSYSEDNSLPKFPGGQKAFEKEILFHFQTRKLMQLDISKAKVVATFYVEPDGSMSSIKIESYENEAVKDEFLKALHKIKTKWIPAIENGKKVRKLMAQPLIFYLQ